MPQEKRNAPHILAYIMNIDKDIRNGEYPNTNTMNKKHGWNISRSTFGRYIDILRDTYNAPVEYDFKKNGYYYTDPTYFMRQVTLKEGELLTFSTILPLLEQYKNTPLEESFRSIMKKLSEMLPDNISVDSAFINNEVRFISEPITKLGEGVFEAALKATKLKRTLRFEYKASGKTKFDPREFDPYHLICQGGSWYLLGHSHHSDAIRIYAMARIQNAQVTQNFFAMPKDFDIKKHIDPEMGVWRTTAKKVKVEIEFSPELKSYVTEREWRKDQVMKTRRDGSVRLSFKTNQMNKLCSWILSFGGGAKVINPPELREQVKAAAKKILKANS